MSSDSDLVPVLLVAYDEDADLEVDNEGHVPTVENHDELVEAGKTHEEVRALKRESAEKHDLNVIDPGDPLWDDRLEDLGSGETIDPADLREQAAGGA